MGVRNIEVATNRGRQKAWRNGSNLANYEMGPDTLAGTYVSSLDSTGTAEAELVGLDLSNRHRLFNSFVAAQRTPILCPIQPNASIVSLPFFVNSNATEPIVVTRIDCIYATANGAAQTAVVTKDGAGVAPGSGVAVMSNTFDLNTTTNTLQTATVIARGLIESEFNTSVTVQAGEQLSLLLSTAVTSLAGLVLQVWVKPFLGAVPAVIFCNANAAVATKTIYLNVIPGQTVTGVSMRWSAAATDAGAVTIDVTKDVSTNAPGAGTSVLTAAQSVKGTINTTVYPALSATAATLRMDYKDRLAIKTTGVLTALAGLVVTVTFAEAADLNIAITDQMALNTAVDHTIFIADKFYELIDVWGSWSTASTSNKTLLTKDTGTTAPGAGSALITDNASAGLDTSATANTPVAGTLTTVKPLLIIAPGDRLGVKNTGTTGALVGNVLSVRLRKI